MAALAAVGVGSLAGLRGARAQEPTEPGTDGAAVAPEVRIVPCVETSYAGNILNGQPNYIARADTAEFKVFAPMDARGDSIVLFSDEIGGAAKTSMAAFQGTVVRNPDGRLLVDTLQLQWPFTAHDDNGTLYNVIGLAHEQDVPVGVVIMAGQVNMGELVFEKGVFDPNNPVVGFDAGTTLMVGESMRSDLEFKVLLTIGGTVYSEIAPAPGAFSAFLDGPLLKAMDEAKRKDAEAACTYAVGDGYEDCFLTSACCSVIGLRDKCWELQTLRRFRDGWLSSFAVGRADIERYYREAPAVAQRLGRSAGGRRELLSLYWRYIVPSAVLARLGANRMAHALYRRMMLRLLGPARA